MAHPFEQWLSLDSDICPPSGLDSLEPLRDIVHRQHVRVLTDDDNDLLDGPRSPMGNGDYINLDDLHSHGEYEFVLLNSLEPPTDKTQ